MPVGVEDGTHYETKIDHLLDRPLTFEERAEPVQKAIETGDFDPVGGNYTPFKPPPEPYREPTGEVQTAMAIKGTPVHPWAMRSDDTPSVDDLKDNEEDMEKRAREYDSKGENVPRNTPPGQEEEASAKPIRIGMPKNVVGKTTEGHVMSDEEFIPEAGKQYAMADMAPEGMRIPVARMVKNLKEQYGGGGGGAFSTGAVDAEKKAASIPGKTSLTKVTEEPNMYGEPMHVFKFNNGKDKGDLHISEKGDGSHLHIEWMGLDRGKATEGAKVYDVGPQSFGYKDIKGIVPHLKKEFPDAEIVSGVRVSGARQKAGIRDELTFLPLKPEGVETAKALREAAVAKRKYKPVEADFEPGWRPSNQVNEFTTRADFRHMTNSEFDMWRRDVNSIPHDRWPMALDRDAQVPWGYR